MEFIIGTLELQKIFKIFVATVKLNAEDSTGRILLEASDEGLCVFSNNGLVGLSYRTENIKIISQGATSFDYSKVRSFVASVKPFDKGVGAEFFHILSTDRSTTLSVSTKFENGKTSNSTLKVPNYNTALISKPLLMKDPNFVFNSDLFRAVMNKTMYAINPTLQQSNSALLGMNIKFSPDKLIFTGADGTMLSEYEIKNSINYTSNDVILSYDFVNTLRRLLPEDVQMIWQILSGAVIVKFEEITLSGRRIVGAAYPDYNSVFDNFDFHLNMNKRVLMSSLGSISDSLEPDDNYRLTIEIKDKKLRMYNGIVDTDIELDDEGGLDFIMDINGKSLIQTVDAIKDDYVLLKFNRQNKPLILDSSSYNNQKAIIMTLKRR